MPPSAASARTGRLSPGAPRDHGPPGRSPNCGGWELLPESPQSVRGPSPRGIKVAAGSGALSPRGRKIRTRGESIFHSVGQGVPQSPCLQEWGGFLSSVLWPCRDTELPPKLTWEDLWVGPEETPPGGVGSRAPTYPGAPQPPLHTHPSQLEATQCGTEPWGVSGAETKLRVPWLTALGACHSQPRAQAPEHPSQMSPFPPRMHPSILPPASQRRLHFTPCRCGDKLPFALGIRFPWLCLWARNL